MIRSESAAATVHSAIVELEAEFLAQLFEKRNCICVADRECGEAIPATVEIAAVFVERDDRFLQRKDRVRRVEFAAEQP